MWPDELYDLVAELGEKIRRYGDVYRSNESATRYSLIDPVLTALGWDLADTSRVLPEYPLRGSESGRGRSRVADYAMLHESGRPQFFVEAKNLDTVIDKDSPAVEQAINYTIRSDCEYVVVTNGDTWEAYRPRASGELHERRTTAFRIEDEDHRSTVTAMLWLWRWRWESSDPVTPPAVEVPTMMSTPVAPTPHVEYPNPPPPAAPTPPSATSPNSPRQSTEPIPTVTANSSHESDSDIAAHLFGTALNQLTDVTGKVPLQTMTFPDGKSKPVGKWNRLQIATVEWLIETGKLTESDCPLTNPRRTHLVHTTPYRRDGKRFTQPAPINQFWIDGHASARNHVSRANDILKAAKVDPATVFVA